MNRPSFANFNSPAVSHFSRERRYGTQKSYTVSNDRGEYILIRLILNLNVNSDLITSTINDVRLRATSASSTHSFVEQPQRPQSSIGFFNQSNWNSSSSSSVSTNSNNSNNYSSPSTARTQSPRPRRPGMFNKKFCIKII